MVRFPVEWMYVVFIVFMVVWIISIITIPLLLVWALNTLFGLGLAYSFWTWLASFIVLGLLTTKVTFKGV